MRRWGRGSGKERREKTELGLEGGRGNIAMSKDGEHQMRCIGQWKGGRKEQCTSADGGRDTLIPS